MLSSAQKLEQTLKARADKQVLRELESTTELETVLDRKHGEGEGAETEVAKRAALLGTAATHRAAMQDVLRKSRPSTRMGQWTAKNQAAMIRELGRAGSGGAGAGLSFSMLAKNLSARPVATLEALQAEREAQAALALQGKQKGDQLDMDGVVAGRTWDRVQYRGEGWARAITLAVQESWAGGVLRVAWGLGVRIINFGASYGLMVWLEMPLPSLMGALRAVKGNVYTTSDLAQFLQAGLGKYVIFKAGTALVQVMFTDVLGGGLWADAQQLARQDGGKYVKDDADWNDYVRAMEARDPEFAEWLKRRETRNRTWLYLPKAVYDRMAASLQLHIVLGKTISFAAFELLPTAVVFCAGPIVWGSLVAGTALTSIPLLGSISSAVAVSVGSAAIASILRARPMVRGLLKLLHARDHYRLQWGQWGRLPLPMIQEILDAKGEDMPLNTTSTRAKVLLHALGGDTVQGHTAVDAAQAGATAEQMLREEGLLGATSMATASHAHAHLLHVMQLAKKMGLRDLQIKEILRQERLSYGMTDDIAHDIAQHSRIIPPLYRMGLVLTGQESVRELWKDSMFTRSWDTHKLVVGLYVQGVRRYAGLVGAVATAMALYGGAHHLPPWLSGLNIIQPLVMKMADTLLRYPFLKAFFIGLGTKMVVAASGVGELVEDVQGVFRRRMMSQSDAWGDTPEWWKLTRQWCEQNVAQTVILTAVNSAAHMVARPVAQQSILFGIGMNASEQHLKWMQMDEERDISQVTANTEGKVRMAKVRVAANPGVNAALMWRLHGSSVSDIAAMIWAMHVEAHAGDWFYEWWNRSPMKQDGDTLDANARPPFEGFGAESAEPSVLHSQWGGAREESDAELKWRMEAYRRMPVPGEDAGDAQIALWQWAQEQTRIYDTVRPDAVERMQRSADSALQHKAAYQAQAARILDLLKTSPALSHRTALVAHALQLMQSALSNPDLDITSTRSNAHAEFVRNAPSITTLTTEKQLDAVRRAIVGLLDAQGDAFDQEGLLIGEMQLAAVRSVLASATVASGTMKGVPTLSSPISPSETLLFKLHENDVVEPGGLESLFGSAGEGGTVLVAYIKGQFIPVQGPKSVMIDGRSREELARLDALLTGLVKGGALLPETQTEFRKQWIGKLQDEGLIGIYAPPEMWAATDAEAKMYEEFLTQQWREGNLTHDMIQVLEAVRSVRAYNSASTAVKWTRFFPLHARESLKAALDPVGDLLRSQLAARTPSDVDPEETKRAMRHILMLHPGVETGMHDPERVLARLAWQWHSLDALHREAEALEHAVSAFHTILGTIPSEQQQAARDAWKGTQEQWEAWKELRNSEEFQRLLVNFQNRHLPETRVPLSRVMDELEKVGYNSVAFQNMQKITGDWILAARGALENQAQQVPPRMEKLRKKVVDRVEATVDAELDAIFTKMHDEGVLNTEPKPEQTTEGGESTSRSGSGTGREQTHIPRWLWNDHIYTTAQSVLRNTVPEQVEKDQETKDAHADYAAAVKALHMQGPRQQSRKQETSSSAQQQQKRVESVERDRLLEFAQTSAQSVSREQVHKAAQKWVKKRAESVVKDVVQNAAPTHVAAKLQEERRNILSRWQKTGEEQSADHLRIHLVRHLLHNQDEMAQDVVKESVKPRLEAEVPMQSVLHQEDVETDAKSMIMQAVTRGDFQPVIETVVQGNMENGAVYTETVELAPAPVVREEHAEPSPPVELKPVEDPVTAATVVVEDAPVVSGWFDQPVPWGMVMPEQGPAEGPQPWGMVLPKFEVMQPPLTSEPKPDILEPEPTRQEPEVVTPKPKPDILEPEPTRQEPEVVTPKPKPDILEPEPTRQEPEVVTPKPKPDILEPEPTRQEPEVVTPEVVTQDEVLQSLQVLSAKLTGDFVKRFNRVRTNPSLDTKQLYAWDAQRDAVRRSLVKGVPGQLYVPGALSAARVATIMQSVEKWEAETRELEKELQKFEGTAHQNAYDAFNEAVEREVKNVREAMGSRTSQVVDRMLQSGDDVYTAAAHVAMDMVPEHVTADIKTLRTAAVDMGTPISVTYVYHRLMEAAQQVAVENVRAAVQAGDEQGERIVMQSWAAEVDAARILEHMPDLDQGTLHELADRLGVDWSSVIAMAPDATQVGVEHVIAARMLYVENTEQVESKKAEWNTDAIYDSVKSTVQKSVEVVTAGLQESVLQRVARVMGVASEGVGEFLGSVSGEVLKPHVSDARKKILNHVFSTVREEAEAHQVTMAHFEHAVDEVVHETAENVLRSEQKAQEEELERETKGLWELLSVEDLLGGELSDVMRTVAEDADRREHAVWGDMPEGVHGISKEELQAWVRHQVSTRMHMDGDVKEMRSAFKAFATGNLKWPESRANEFLDGLEDDVVLSMDVEHGMNTLNPEQLSRMVGEIGSRDQAFVERFMRRRIATAAVREQRGTTMLAGATYAHVVKELLSESGKVQDLMQRIPRLQDTDVWKAYNAVPYVLAARWDQVLDAPVYVMYSRIAQNLGRALSGGNVKETEQNLRANFQSLGLTEEHARILSNPETWVGAERGDIPVEAVQAMGDYILQLYVLGGDNIMQGAAGNLNPEGRIPSLATVGSHFWTGGKLLKSGFKGASSLLQSEWRASEDFVHAAALQLRNNVGAGAGGTGARMAVPNLVGELRRQSARINGIEGELGSVYSRTGWSHDVAGMAASQAVRVEGEVHTPPVSGPSAWDQYKDTAKRAGKGAAHGKEGREAGAEGSLYSLLGRMPRNVRYNEIAARYYTTDNGRFVSASDVQASISQNTRGIWKDVALSMAAGIGAQALKGAYRTAAGAAGEALLGVPMSEQDWMQNYMGAVIVDGSGKGRVKLAASMADSSAAGRVARHSARILVTAFYDLYHAGLTPNAYNAADAVLDAAALGEDVLRKLAIGVPGALGVGASRIGDGAFLNAMYDYMRGGVDAHTLLPSVGFAAAKDVGWSLATQRFVYGVMGGDALAATYDMFNDPIAWKLLFISDASVWEKLTTSADDPAMLNKLLDMELEKQVAAGKLSKEDLNNPSAAVEKLYVKFGLNPDT